MRQDPETISHARESAEKGKFEVSIHYEGEKIGTLDETFWNKFDASRAATNSEIPDVDITAEVRGVSDE